MTGFYPSEIEKRMSTRSTEERIVLLLCGICILGLFPFAVMRFIRGDFIVFVVDSIGLIGSSIAFIYVYRTHSTQYAGQALAALALGGMVVNVFVLGPTDLYFLYPVIIATFFLASSRLALGLTLSAFFMVSIGLLKFVDWFDFAKLFLSLFACILFAFVFANQRNQQRDKLLQLSSEDPLTGVGNRRALHKHIEQLIAGYKRTNEPMSAIILDLDNFKLVNDRFGHIEGDNVLKRVAAAATERIRATDNLYRYGGDEFIILAISATEATAWKLADDIRQLVAHELANVAESITVSIGVAQYKEDETADQWLERADKAMYSAKNDGKNSVSV